MVRVTEQILQRMVDAIVRAVQPEKVILFGSRARADGQAGSDVDLLIVEREPFSAGRSRRRELRRVRRALAAFRVPKDLLVYSADEVVRWQGSASHVIAGALREGRTLYERS